MNVTEPVAPAVTVEASVTVEFVPLVKAVVGLGVSVVVDGVDAPE